MEKLTLGFYLRPANLISLLFRYLGITVKDERITRKEKKDTDGVNEIVILK